MRELVRLAVSFSRVGNDFRAMRDDAGDFQPDHDGTGQRDKPRDAARRHQVRGTAGRRRCLDPKHDGGGSVSFRGIKGNSAAKGNFKGLRKWRGDALNALRRIEEDGLQEGRKFSLMLPRGLACTRCVRGGSVEVRNG